MPSFTSTIKKELLSVKFISITFLVALAYISISVLLLNSTLFTSLVKSGTSFLELLLLFVSLIQGLWTSLSVTDFVLTMLTAVFVGANAALIIQTVSLLENRGKLHLSVGGATIFSLVATGCASCGLSFLSVLGLSASLSFLPFHGLELHIGSVVLLLLSALYMLKKLHDGVYCKIPQKQKEGKNVLV